MPPLLNVNAIRPHTRLSIPSFLVPFLSQPAYCRSASILSSLSDVPEAYNKRIRRGRGPSSGKGKTSGRGHKGQKQHGKVPAGFNGGQTTAEVQAGSRGFKNMQVRANLKRPPLTASSFTLDLARVNIDRIQSWIDQGRIDSSKPITIKELHSSRCTHGIKDGVKLLARNATALYTPIHIVVSRASAAAIAAVESVGGTVQTRYYTSSAIRRVLKGLSHPTQSFLSPPPTSSIPNLVVDTPEPSAFRYRLPDPASRKDIEYYRDPAHRGYLSYQLSEGESPSLFFKKPGYKSASAEGAKTSTKKKAESEKLW